MPGVLLFAFCVGFARIVVAASAAGVVRRQSSTTKEKSMSNVMTGEKDLVLFHDLFDGE
jgi:archaellin